MRLAVLASGAGSRRGELILCSARYRGAERHAMGEQRFAQERYRCRVLRAGILPSDICTSYQKAIYQQDPQPPCSWSAPSRHRSKQHQSSRPAPRWISAWARIATLHLFAPSLSWTQPSSLGMCPAICITAQLLATQTTTSNHGGCQGASRVAIGIKLYRIIHSVL